MSSRPHRILFVEANEDSTVGGSHQCLLDLVKRLDRSRFEPVVLFYQDNPFAARIEALGIAVHRWDRERVHERWAEVPARSIRGVAKRVTAVLRRLAFLRREAISLVHLNNGPAAGYYDWLPAARVLGLPCVGHARAIDAPPRSRIGRHWRRSFDRVIAVSDHVALACRDSGIPGDRLVRIYDGIDVEALIARARRGPSSVRREIGVPEDRVLVVMVGHLRPWKGQALAIDALARLDADVQARMHLAFVGGVPPEAQGYLRELEEKVSAADLLERVSFLGERPDVPDLMRAADVVLHASTIPEPFGLVVLEGMALGRAVVASHLGGPAETVAPGTGLTFDPERPDELADLLTELSWDTALRETLGRRGAVHAARFSSDDTAAAVEQLYGELLAQPLRSRPRRRPSTAAAARV
jgi:glycosyltransferase involved in cell wall biosynthesis